MSCTVGEGKLHQINIARRAANSKADATPAACYAADMQAPYAVRTTRGRQHPEADAPGRSPWQRDRDRIIHSSAFRKLQYKTQVFVTHEGDYYRTRLTHSLEVAQIGRSIARSLHLDEDLTEALALAHDVGHPPFGHAGEDGLNAAMAAYGGFNHNAQSLRVVTLLEGRYAAFDGLNLTWETLEGLAKHNGPLTNPHPEIAAIAALHAIDLSTQASAEAQVAALADDIAYHSHDLDDGLRAHLFAPEDLADLPVVGAALLAARAADRAGVRPAASRLRHETIRRVIDAFVTDVTQETARRLATLAPASADAIRAAGSPVVAFSPAMAAANAAVKAFLFRRMYRHWRVNRMTSKSRRVTQELFTLLHDAPEMLPGHWHDRAVAGDPAARAHVVADYVAGMTDRFALDERRRLTDPSISG